MPYRYFSFRPNSGTFYKPNSYLKQVLPPSVDPYLNPLAAVIRDSFFDWDPFQHLNVVSILDTCCYLPAYPDLEINNVDLLEGVSQIPTFWKKFWKTDGEVSNSKVGTTWPSKRV